MNEMYLFRADLNIADRGDLEFGKLLFLCIFVGFLTLEARGGDGAATTPW